MMTASIQVLFLLWCAGVAVNAQDIQVSFKPNDFVVEDGDVMVVCNVMGGGSITEFSWLHNGSTVSGVNIENDFGARTSILRLFLLRFLDAGSYMCRATVDNVVHSSSSGMLQIASKLSIVAETTQEAFEGDDAVLVCNVTSFPAPTLRWYRGSSSNPPPLATQMVNDDDFGLLKLTGVSREMAGTYTCHGNYAFGSNEVDIDFVVLTVPDVTSITASPNMTIDKGSPLSLDCNATGVRAPTYSWQFDEEELDIEADPAITVDPITGILEIANATFCHAGIYWCLAKNRAGNNSDSIQITVIGSPDIISPPSDSLVLAGIDKRAQISCEFKANPNATATWFRMNESELVMITTESDDRYSFSANGIFTIARVMASDDDFYTCNVSNSEGMTSRLKELRILMKPVRPVELEVVSQGSNWVKLQWTQAGAPSPQRQEQEFDVEFIAINNQQSEPVFTRVVLANNTRPNITNVIPGMSYNIQVRAVNLGGASLPSGLVNYTSLPTPPTLLFFNASALGDGRSVLLLWRLEFTGGSEVTRFSVKVFGGVMVRELDLNIEDDSFLVTDLSPTTLYTFSAELTNRFGTSQPVTANANTTVAAPGKPTPPAIVQLTTRTLVLSFSVDSGSAPITNIFFEITDMESIGTVQHNLTANESEEELIQKLSREGNKLHIEIVLKQLQNQRIYSFAVFAENAIGIGPLSDRTGNISLDDDRILYYIIAGVVGGVAFVILVIAVVSLFICCFHKRVIRGKKMVITSDKPSNFTFESGGHLTTIRETTDNQHVRVEETRDLPSPCYNSLLKYQNGGGLEGGNVDEPDIGMSIQSPDQQPGKALMSPGTTDRGNASHQFQGSLSRDVVPIGRSVESYPLLGHAAHSGTLDGSQGTATSQSTSAENRNSYDLDNIPNTSYMTDV